MKKFILLCLLVCGDAQGQQWAPPRVSCNGQSKGYPSAINFGGAACSGSSLLNVSWPGARGAMACTGSDKVTGLDAAGSILCGADIGAGSGAPTAATYITQTPDATLSAEQAMSLLGTGLVKSTTGTGVQSIAVSGTDYAPATSGSAVLLGNGAGGFSNYAGTSCTNQFTRSLSAAGAATCAGIGVADFTANQGTTAQVLHGNAAGQPSWGAVADGDVTPAYSGTGACAANKWASTLSRNAAPTCTQPDYSNLTGTPTDLSGEPFITKVASANLSNEFALGSLATGLLKNTTTTGVPTIAASGTDYAPATSGSALLLGNGAGGFTNYGGAASCTNQFFTGLSSAGASTCTTATLASAQFANQGTTTQLLHGNAAGNPSWAAASLTADVTGILPLANGGTSANLTAANGAVVYSDASKFALSAVGTSGQILQSAGAAAPTWVSGPRMIRVSGSNFTTTATTNTNITGLSITTAAATPYYFDCLLDMTGTATGGPRAAVVVTTSTVTSMAAAIRHHTTSATTQLYTGASATGTQSATCAASCLTTEIPFHITGMVNINANAGTITIAAANSTSGQTTTVKIGSMCIWWTP